MLAVVITIIHLDLKKLVRLLILPCSSPEFDNWFNFISSPLSAVYWELNCCGASLS